MPFGLEGFLLLLGIFDTINSPMQQKAQAVSIVIPVFNEENYIGTCLDLIQKQSVLPNEVIIVDNNCTDKTIEIAKQYPFVRVIKEKKQGVLFARNTGLNAAKGEIIGRIDTDTHLSHDWVETALKAFSANKEVAAITGPVWYYDMPLRRFGFWLDKKIRGHVARSSEVFPFLFGTNMAIRKSAWISVRDNTCDKREMYEDIDLAIHLFQHKLRIDYREDLTGGMAARRFDDTFINFYRYIRLYRVTYDMHQMKAKSARLAMAVYLIFFVICQPMRWTYDPVTNKRSVRNLFRRAIPRKNPMD
jgi:glycosyltransferase involved in cell wall biosynthesis